VLILVVWRGASTCFGAKPQNGRLGSLLRAILWGLRMWAYLALSSLWVYGYGGGEHLLKKPYIGHEDQEEKKKGRVGA
jgi:hypothetical protein